MAAPKFRLEVSYSERTGEPVAAYVRVREGKVSQTKEISDGLVFADYGADGDLLGIELLGPCPVEILEKLTVQESVEIRQFLQRGVRREMIVAGKKLAENEDIVPSVNLN